VTNSICTSQIRAARIAGAAYFIIIASSILFMILGPFKLIVKGNTEATFLNISANELLFRGGAIYDLATYAGVVILSVALFVVLKPVNKNLALVAMLWRLGEAVLGCLTAVLGSLTILLLLSGKDYLSAFGAEQRQALVSLLLDVNSAAISIVFVFLSLGSIVYCYLFYRSRYIPRVLAVFGILAFAITLVGTFAGILYPNDALMMFGAPAILFEITIGLWLWIKGIKVEQGENT